MHGAGFPGATTAAPETTEATASPTTEASATTGTTTTTTTPSEPDDLHPTWGDGVGWAEWWPDASEVARYRATTREGTEIDLTTIVEYGVEWKGDTWDRIVFGTLEAGSDGIAM